MATLEQRLTCFVIDDCVAVDAGSIAIALNGEQRNTVRDIIVTHPHMDHVASLPIFIDDLYPSLQEPVRIYATAEVIELLERDVFNWNVYPRFSDLKNDYGPVMEYIPIPIGAPFRVAHRRSVGRLMAGKESPGNRADHRSQSTALQAWQQI